MKKFKNEENKFVEASKKERFAFKKFIELYNLYQTDNYEIFITPYDGYESYDVMIQKYNDGTIEKRWIIEIKIRDVKGSHCGYEEGFILEKRKYNKLKEIYDVDADRNEILYINFTSEETLVFNLTNTRLKWETKMMNKATMKSNFDKVNKKVALLDHNDATRYNYIFDEQQYNNHLAKIEREELIQKRKDICLEDRQTIEKILGL